MLSRIIFLLILLSSAGANAEVLRSDLSLLSDNLTSENTEDPYFDLIWHGRMAAYGNPDSQFFMAQVYEQGKVVPKDMEKAIDFYRMAANQGHLESCRKLAELFPEEAIDWYQKAANLNDPQAQMKLSHLYEEQGDSDQAVYWLERALRQLFPDSDDLTLVSPDLKRLRGE